MIPALSDVTGDGYVFRVDMRLRPNGDAGPLAVSTAMLEEYLMVQGREWERFAWLKGRVVSAPVFASNDEFERQERSLAGVVRPFVFRKYLDFGAIDALRDLHGLIRAESSRRNAGREERADNVKLGRGGIREIEFIAQAFQLIRGGRDPGLRVALDAGDARHARPQGVLPEATCDRLAASYVFLRNLEHPLQYIDDAQTHVLPVDAAARGRVADAARRGRRRRDARRVPGGAGFVAGVFDAVFAEPTETARQAPMPTTWNAPGDGDENALVEHLEDQGFRDPAGHRAAPARRAERAAGAGSERIGARRHRAPAAARAGLARSSCRTAGAAHDIGPDEHFARFAQFAEVIAGRNTYLTLLNQFPQALERVMRMLAASRWAAEYLTRASDPARRAARRTPARTRARLDRVSAAVRRQLDEADGDQERQMNLLREVHHAQVFRLLAPDLDGLLTVERLADHLSALADLVLGLTLERVLAHDRQRHREMPRFAVIGYGKLGGKELGYVSDLDLIFLYDDEHRTRPRSTRGSRSA